MNKKCFLGEKEFVTDILASLNKIIYLEMWIWNTDEVDLEGQPTIKLWTLHELFDINDNFIAGKIRLPFYAQEEFTPY